MSKRFQLTPEQLALQEQRKAKRQKLLEQTTPAPTLPQTRFLSRPWIDLKQDLHPAPKILTWNLLAQSLVRRELFPTSDCLKAAQRLPMLAAEVVAYDADIMCCQEVDSLDKLLPNLEPTYSTHYAAGPGKKHGCLIAFKEDWEKLADHLIEFDEQEIRTEGNERARRGSAFRTRNIASLVALKSRSQPGRGVVIGTTHLFWHPSYTYERCRQAGIFLREIRKFQSDNKLNSWPCILAGDFNFSPDDPAYALLVGDSLTDGHKERLEASRVVHVSIDPTAVPVTASSIKEDEDQAGDPDRVITNARRATIEDGLLSDDELVALFSQSSPLRSAYDEGLKAHRESNDDLRTFGQRVGLPVEKKGYNEPEYTSYTHYWKTVLGKRLFCGWCLTNNPRLYILLVTFTSRNMRDWPPHIAPTNSVTACLSKAFAAVITYLFVHSSIFQ
ncbi:Endo/exonuclease/phosphatase domain-containing protein [Mycena kentingensis (nom. inval.)]|nr:Endo/exonuclease/phosphatase domain-containing protein [Mycena kentingensis (nom. inval.)]